MVMNWNNLKTERCPKCECKLFSDDSSNILKCALNDGLGGQFSCDFIITQSRMREITNNIALKDYDHDNLDELNNL